MLKRNSKRKLGLTVIILSIVIVSIYFFRRDSVVVFYMENHSGMHTISVSIDSIRLSDSVSKNDFPYKFLEPLQINRGVENVSVTIDERVRANERLVFYLDTHYVKVQLNERDQRVILTNTRDLIMYH